MGAPDTCSKCNRMADHEGGDAPNVRMLCDDCIPRPSVEMGKVKTSLRNMVGDSRIPPDVTEKLCEAIDRLESIAAPVPSAELGEITKDFRTWADRVTQKCQVGCADTEDCDNCDLWSELEPLLTRVESLAAPAQQSQPTTKPYKPHHGFVCARCDGVNMGRAYLVCDDCISQSAESIAAPETQPPHHPELHSEICACLSAQGRPPSKEQLEKWRDMLGGETRQPGERDHHETPLDYWRSTAEKLRRELEDAQADLRKQQPGESVAEVVREIGEYVTVGDFELEGTVHVDADKLRDWISRLSRASVGPAEVWVRFHQATGRLRVFNERPSPDIGDGWRRWDAVPVHAAQPQPTVGPTEVYVQCFISHGPGDVPGAMFDLQHGSESIPVAVCVHANPDRPGGMAIPQKFKRKRAAVHGVEAKQYCEGCKAYEKETRRLRELLSHPSAQPKQEAGEIDAKKSFAEIQRHNLEQRDHWKARALAAEAQLAESEEINAEYRTTIVQQQVDVAKAEARLRQSADDCDDCEHTETVAAMEKLVEDRTDRYIAAARRHNAARRARDELRRKLERAEAAAKGSKAALGEALRKLEGQEKRVAELEKQLTETRRKFAGYQDMAMKEHEELRRPREERTDEINTRTSGDRRRQGAGAMATRDRRSGSEPARGIESERQRQQSVSGIRSKVRTIDPQPESTEQDDRGELPVCPDCGEVPFPSPNQGYGDVKYYQHWCRQPGSTAGGRRIHGYKEDWLRHVAERTVCRDCGVMPNVQGDKGPRTAFCCCTCCENERGPCDGDCGNRLHTPAEWLKRNEVTCDNETGHARGVGDCSGDDGVVGADEPLSITPPLERARAYHEEASKAGAAGYLDEAMAEMDAAFEAILDHLEGEHAQVTRLIRASATHTHSILKLQLGVTATERRLDALEAAPKRNEARNGSDDMGSAENDRTPADREERQGQVGSVSKRNEVKDEDLDGNMEVGLGNVRENRDSVGPVCSVGVSAKHRSAEVSENPSEQVAPALKRNEETNDARADRHGTTATRAGEKGSRGEGEATAAESPQAVSEEARDETAVGSALERAREAMMAHEPDTWAGHVDRIARVLGCILEHLEGTEDSKRHYLRHIGNKLDTLEARLDAADERRERAKASLATQGLTLEHAIDALCGADESEGDADGAPA